MSPSRSAGPAIGVDIGGTNIRAARVDRAGRPSGLLKVRTESASDATRAVIDLCLVLLDDDVEAIGIGVPGRLDRQRTTVLSSGYVKLAGQPLGELVSNALGRPVILENDAGMALLAELQVGAATDVDDVVLFTAGTGIGGAVAIAGRLLQGRGNAGQLGHLALDAAGPECNCGRRGCSETLASGTALRHLIYDADLPADTTIESLLARRRDDPAAAEVLTLWAGAWRAAIDTVVAVLDPELVLVGGGLGAAAVTAIEATQPTTSPWFECSIRPTQLGNDAGVIGAGLRALDR